MRKKLNEQIALNLHSHGYAADTGFAQIILDNAQIKAFQGRKEKFLYAYFQRGNAHLDGYIVDNDVLYLVCVESDPYAYLLDESYIDSCPYLSQQEITNCFHGLHTILGMSKEMAAYRSHNVAKLGRLLQSKQVQTIEKVVFLLLTNRPTLTTSIVPSDLYWSVNDTKIECQLWCIEQIASLLNDSTEPASVQPPESPASEKIILDENSQALLHELCLRTNGVTDEVKLQRELFRLGSIKLQQLANCLSAYAETASTINPDVFATINRLIKSNLPPKFDFWPDEKESANIIYLANDLLKKQ